MSMWTRTTAQEVYISIRGDIYHEHIEYLQNSLLEQLLYGYQYIVLDLTGVCSYQDYMSEALQNVQSRIEKKGGNLIVKGLVLQ